MGMMDSIIALAKDKHIQAGLLAPLGVGIAAGIATGSASTGMSSFGNAAGGASLGFMKGGFKGAIAGGIAGGAIGAGVSELANKSLGTFGSAAVAGISASLGASLGVAGMVRGGIGYAAQMAMLKKMVPENMMGTFGKQFEGMIGHNPITSPKGFASNISDMAKSMSRQSPIIQKISNVLEKNETAKRFVNAAFGSPGLLELAEKGGIESASNGQLAKVIGKDIIEGLPIGLGTGLIGAAFGGFSDKGEAGKRRKENTDFGSPYQGPKTSNRIHQRINKRTLLRDKFYKRKRKSIGPVHNPVLAGYDGFSKGKRQGPIHKEGLANRHGPWFNRELSGGKELSKEGLRETRGLRSKFFKTFYPKEFKKRSDSIINTKFGKLGRKKSMHEIYRTLGARGLFDQTKKLRQAHSDLMISGKKFGTSLGTDIMLNIDNSVRKTVGKAAVSSYKGANAISKAVMGASIPQIGLAVGAIAGLGYAAVASQSDDPMGAISGAFKEHREQLRQSAKPTYGHTELGQSVSGLTFGLHNKRHG